MRFSNVFVFFILINLLVACAETESNSAINSRVVSGEAAPSGDLDDDEQDALIFGENHSTAHQPVSESSVVSKSVDADVLPGNQTSTPAPSVAGKLPSAPAQLMQAASVSSVEQAANTANVMAAVNIALTLVTTPVPDTTAPVITLSGSHPMTVVQGNAFEDPGATAQDNVDASVVVTASGAVDTTVLGAYTITYSATDSAGNASELTRTVDVVASPATFSRAHRLLLQTTFGPVSADLERVQQVGTTAWIDEQLNKPSAYDSNTDAHQTHLERMIEISKHAQPHFNWDDSGTTPFNQTEASFRTDEYQMAAWWENALGLHPTHTLHGSDQLRQRVAFALSQLLVVSDAERPLYRRGEGLAAYYDILAKHAFGNYRNLLGEVARSPTMGVFLSHQGNQKTDSLTGTRPDENFAREVMQLFTIGLYDLNNDGTPDRDGNPLTLGDAGTNLVSSYTQGDIEELAKVMTGWDLVGNKNYGHINNKTGDYTVPMEFTASEHELGNVTVMGQAIDLNSGSDGSGMDQALDVLFNHPNVAPFVSKHLIMRLVTSNPSPAYINRVATVFNDDGQGVRGNLKAVVRAILIDYEARRDDNVTDDGFGKFKEPLLAWTQLLRALEAVPLNGWTGLDDALVDGVYWFKHPHRYLGQGALRSPSVFNFYSPDYVPSDNTFASNALVAPETQILTDQFYLEYNNKLVELLQGLEKNEITINDGKVLSEFAKDKSFSSAQIMLVSFDKAMAVFKQALDDDYDNIEADAPDGVPYRDKAVESLIAHLDQSLFGEAMNVEYKAALRTYLLNARDLKSQDNFKEALKTVRNAYHLVVSSSLYMVQK